MKQLPELSKVQERMRPGVLTSHGFLGDDNRPLADILADDGLKVEHLGLTHEQIADALQRLTDAARAALETVAVVDDRWEVQMQETRGKLPCPWPAEGVFQKGIVTCFDRKTRNRLQWTILSVHMVRKHGFYEGKGSPFRLDPAVLKETLGLEPVEEVEED